MLMETAIAIPRPISEVAEQLARRLGMSLGELYTAAIVAYISTYPSGDIRDSEKINCPSRAGSHARLRRRGSRLCWILGCFISSTSLTAALNQVYATESSALDPVLVKIQSASLGGETW